MKVGEVDEAQSLGAVEGGFERPAAQTVSGGIEECAGGRGDREPSQRRGLVVRKRHTMGADAGAALPAGPAHDHMHDATRRGPDVPRVRGRAVAHDRAPAERQHRRPSSPFNADQRMADGVHAPRDRVEMASGDPPRDRG